MSRRRKPKSTGAGAVRLLIECTYSARGSHPPYRIARCTTWTDPFTPGVVRVEYIHQGDAAVAQRDRVRARGVKPSLDLRDAWITYPLTCGTCGRHLPIWSNSLAELVARLAMLGVSRVELAELTPR